MNSSTDDQAQRSIEVFDPHNDNNATGTRSTDVQVVEEGSGSSPATNATSGSGREALNKWMTFERKSKNTSDRDDSITDQSNGTGTSATVKAGKDEDQGTSSDHNNSSSIGQSSPSSSNKILTGASIAERTAEWGIFVRSDVGERSFKATATRSEQEENGGNRSKKKTHLWWSRRGHQRKAKQEEPFRGYPKS